MKERSFRPVCLGNNIRLIVIGIDINMCQMILIIVLHQFFDQFRLNRNILHTEKDVVPSGHLCHHLKKLRKKYLSGIFTLHRSLICTIRIFSGTVKFSLIHIAHSTKEIQLRAVEKFFLHRDKTGCLSNQFQSLRQLSQKNGCSCI